LPYNSIILKCPRDLRTAHDHRLFFQNNVGLLYTKWQNFGLA
jgi:hypothetical protein